jgi:hypothetical protein
MAHARVFIPVTLGCHRLHARTSWGEVLMTRPGHGLFLRLSLIPILGVSLSCIHGLAEGRDFMIGVKIYDFRGDFANLIMVREIAAEARAVKPDIRLNVHPVPWREKDFHQGIRSIVGQDVAEIASSVDMLSPVCYAHMVKQDASWISSVVWDVSRRAGKPVILSIQVKEAYLTEKLTVGEFAPHLMEVRKPPSAGVTFWNWPMLADDPEKASQLITLENP